MNDPTSLQNLHPIVLPAWTGLWPVAPGWYLLAAVLLFLIFRSIARFIKKRRTNAYRREALENLATLVQKPGSKEYEQSLQLLPVLLKSTALRAYSRPLVASLYGRAWLNFLDKTIHSDRFQNGPGRLLLDLSCARPETFLVGKEEEISDLFELCRHWIGHHLPEAELGDTND